MRQLNRLNRPRVGRGRLRLRSGWWVMGALLLPLLFCGMGCNWLTGMNHPRQMRQGLLIRCNTPKAVLYIDEQMVSTLGDTQPTRLGMKPGTYRVVVKRVGYFDRYFDVRVRKDTYTRLTVTLVPELE